MCKTNVKTNIYYANICKHEHEKNMTRQCCKIVFKISVKYIKGNARSYFYLYPFGNLAQGTSKKVFMCALSKEAFQKKS